MVGCFRKTGTAHTWPAKVKIALTVSVFFTTPVQTAITTSMAEPADKRTITSFEEFFPHYLREHADPRTRAIHYAGTLFAIALLVFAVATGRWWLILLAVVSGYAFAWVAHFFVEKNRPATFTYPWWSYISDFRMLWLFLTGRLGPELDKAGVGRG